MNSAVAFWLFFRCLRWAAWLFFFGFCFYLKLDPAPHLNSYGHLLHETEAKIFIPALVAVFAGFFELMMREKAGISRPSFGQIMPPVASAADRQAPKG